MNIGTKLCHALRQCLPCWDDFRLSQPDAHEYLLLAEGEKTRTHDASNLPTLPQDVIYKHILCHLDLQTFNNYIQACTPKHRPEASCEIAQNIPPQIYRQLWQTNFGQFPKEVEHWSWSALQAMQRTLQAYGYLQRLSHASFPSFRSKHPAYTIKVLSLSDSHPYTIDPTTPPGMHQLLIKSRHPRAYFSCYAFDPARSRSIAQDTRLTCALIFQHLVIAGTEQGHLVLWRLPQYPTGVSHGLRITPCREGKTICSLPIVALNWGIAERAFGKIPGSKSKALVQVHYINHTSYWYDIC